jgi:hypothetical protein
MPDQGAEMAGHATSAISALIMTSPVGSTRSPAQTAHAAALGAFFTPAALGRLIAAVTVLRTCRGDAIT